LVRSRVADVLRSAAASTAWQSIVTLVTERLVPIVDNADHRLGTQIRDLLDQHARDQDLATFAVLASLGTPWYKGLEMTREALRGWAADPSRRDAVLELHLKSADLLPLAGLQEEGERWRRLFGWFMDVLFCAEVAGEIDPDLPGKVQAAVVQNLLREVLDENRPSTGPLVAPPHWWSSAIAGTATPWRTAHDVTILTATARALSGLGAWR
jgi:hypothetical protein